MTAGPVRFGLIGAGVAAETHAREMRRLSGGVIHAVQARDPAKAAAFAAAFGIPHSHGDPAALLADPAIDAVIVTTPNGLHLDPAIAAARAGKHVVVEKPLEIDFERAKAIVDACATAGVQLHVVYQRRFSAAAAQALRDVESGALGDVVVVNIVDDQFRTPRYYEKDAWRGTKAFEGGGCVITQATHLIDLAQFVVGPIVAVQARTATRFHAIETEDTAVAALEFANGALGSFSASTAACPGLRHLLMICGTKGSIILNGEHDQIVFRSVAGDTPAVGAPTDFSFVDPTDPRDYPTEGQRRQLEAIVDCIATGTMPPDAVASALWSVRVVDAIYESAATAQRVVVGA